MSNGRVVHCKHESYDVYIGRPSKWGNPFTVEQFGREGAIREYKHWVLTKPTLLAALPELKDKVLGCWCAPLACHGDILMELANRKPTYRGHGDILIEPIKLSDEEEGDL